MPLPIGTGVVVAALGNKRGVVIEAGRNGHYRVQVERVTVWCREEDLAAPSEGTKKRSSHKRQYAPAASRSDDEAVPAGRVDLHGLRVEEALARVVTEIDHALRRGADRVEIVHGKGSGRIKDALHRHLASMPGVTKFRLDPRNPGVTWVLF